MITDTEPAPLTRPTTWRRTDHTAAPVPGLSLSGSISWTWPYRLTLLAAYAIGFVLFDAHSLDLGPIEARLGLSARESFGPLGRVFAGWEPTIWPLPVVPSMIWTWFEGGTPSTGAVRWPAAIAGVVIGLMLSRRMALVLGGRTGVLVALCWLGSLGLIDRSAGAGIDLMLGLTVIAAIDRILARGSDLISGLWLALAFLSGGWPPVAIVALSTVVIGRREASLSWRLLVPPTLAVLGWSAWILKVAPAEAWGAALTLPLTQGPSWMLALGVFALALPWSPLAFLVGSRTIREGWDTPGRSYVVGWLQVSGALPDRRNHHPRPRARSQDARACRARRRLGSRDRTTHERDNPGSNQALGDDHRGVHGRGVDGHGGAGRGLPRDNRLVLQGDRDHPHDRQRARRDFGDCLGAEVPGTRVADHAHDAGHLPQNGAFRLLRSRVELQTQPGTLGTSHRPVDSTELADLHHSRLEHRPRLRNRPSRPPAL